MSGQQFWWSFLFRGWKSTAYGLSFPENLAMYLSVSYPFGFIKPHLWTWQTFILLKGGVCFYDVCFSRHPDLQRAKHNWDDRSHTEVLHGFCFSDSQNLFQFTCLLHSYRNIYILEAWLHDDKWNSISRGDLSYVCISKGCGWVGKDLCSRMLGAENLMCV